MKDGAFVVGIQCGHCEEVCSLESAERQPTKDGTWRCRSCGNEFANEEALKHWAPHMMVSCETHGWE